ncbi:hypothetical protein FCV85_08100 [Vibrio sp. F13]|uniref:hypothetical protein n=1 Tax=unclassified Vibrio TaxID=2614977 RepID=UPI0010BDADA2|nr:hypothetical protein [Vibrio sp. F13]TKG33815.1 hypothetical protein FCV85_08100 [Vibrio sp. F13]
MGKLKSEVDEQEELLYHESLKRASEGYWLEQGSEEYVAQEELSDIEFVGTVNELLKQYGSAEETQAQRKREKPSI